MAALDARTLKALEGKALRVGARTYTCAPSATHLPAARQGGEGFAIPLRDDAEGVAYILKAFHLPTPERRQRVVFLASLDLSTVLSTFEAVPRFAAGGEVPAPNGKGTVPLEGYLCAHIDGDTFVDLLAADWDADTEDRCRLAAQLCCAIQVLEHGEIVHGDLSQGNLMVTSGSPPLLRIIDFDGFGHPLVPPIKVTTVRGGRTFGSDGYRHHSFKQMDESVVVNSDRVAMAVLAFELMVLRGEDTDTLQRMTCLEQSDLDEGVAIAPGDIAQRWPEGWRLVTQAVEAPIPEMAPSPLDWLEAIARRVGARHPSAGRRTDAPKHPAVTILAQLPSGEEVRLQLTQAENSFAALHRRLGWLSYRRRGGRLYLEGVAPSPVHVVGDAPLEPMWGSISVEASQGVEFRWEDFVLLIN